MADVYRIGDTPNFQVACFAADAVTPVTPTGPITVTVYNRKTNAIVSGTPTATISKNLVIVTVPASMATTPGNYRAEAQIQIDSVPTIMTRAYEYEIVPAGS